MGEKVVPALARPTAKVASVSHPPNLSLWPVLFTNVRVAGSVAPVFTQSAPIDRVTVQPFDLAVTEAIGEAEDTVPLTTARTNVAAPAAPNSLEDLIAFHLFISNPSTEVGAGLFR
jgi:hypothetical protein